MSWSDIIISAVSIIITGFASWGIAKLVEFLNSKISDTNLNHMMNTAIETITDVVEASYNAYISALIGTNAFTKEAQQNALDAMLSEIKAILPQATLDCLESTYADLDAWLTLKIKSTLYELEEDNGDFEELEEELESGD